LIAIDLRAVRQSITIRIRFRGVGPMGVNFGALHTYPGVGHTIPQDMHTDLLAAIRLALDHEAP
jgi:hypothetical protein